MGKSSSGVRLLKAPFDLREEQETFHRVLDGSIRGKAADRANHLLFRGHGLRITGLCAAFKRGVETESDGRDGVFTRSRPSYESGAAYSAIIPIVTSHVSTS